MYVNKQFESSEKQDLNYYPANKRYLVLLYTQIIMVYKFNKHQNFDYAAHRLSMYNYISIMTFNASSNIGI